MKPNKQRWLVLLIALSLLLSSLACSRKVVKVQCDGHVVFARDVTSYDTHKDGEWTVLKWHAKKGVSGGLTEASGSFKFKTDDCSIATETIK